MQQKKNKFENDHQGNYIMLKGRIDHEIFWIFSLCSPKALYLWRMGLNYRQGKGKTESGDNLLSTVDRACPFSRFEF